MPRCWPLALFVVVVASAPAFAAPSDELAHARDLHAISADDAAARAILDPLTREADASIAGRAEELLGEIDEASFDYARALGHYAQSLAKDPAGSSAAAAKARYELLSSYGGDLGDLAELDAVRRDPRASSDRSAIDGLASQAASFRGKPRDEALLFVAQAYVERLAAPGRGIAPALVVARDPGADAVTRARAFEVAYAAMVALGDLDRARSELAADPSAPPALVTRIARDLRRRTLHRAALVALSVGVLAFVVAVVESARRRRFAVVRRAFLHPLALVFLCLATFGGWLIAEWWERGDGAVFVSLGLSLLGVHAIVAAWRGAFGDRAARFRVVGGIVAASCVLGAAYLVLERAERRGAHVLEGFRL